MSKRELNDVSNLSKEWLIDRLEDAVQTHDILPETGTQKAATMYDLISIYEEPDPDDESPFAKLIATAQDVRRMDEVFDWIKHLPGKPSEKRAKAQVLFLRSKTKGGRNMSWRKVAKRIQCSHPTAEMLFDKALYELYVIVKSIRDEGFNAKQPFKEIETNVNP